MPKRTRFTNVTPLPPQVSREVAIAMLHNHDEMIELNPLVIEHHPIKTPRDAPADEFLDCVWQELTDRISYLPGGLVKGKVTYRACFHDLPNGLQTHIYAPMGLEIREKWSVGGSLPGEPPEARELGLNLPASGLYLREDGDMSCNVMMASFVRKNLDNSHKVLVERILKKAQRVEAQISADGSSTGAPEFQKGSHMARSQIMHSPSLGSPHGRPDSANFSPPGDSSVHPAMRNRPESTYDRPDSLYSVQSSNGWQGSQNGYAQDLRQNVYSQPPPQSQSQPQPQQQQQQHHQGYAELPETSTTAQKKSFVAELSDTSIPAPRKEFIAELYGSMPEPNIAQKYQQKPVPELTGSETTPSRVSASQSSTN